MSPWIKRLHIYSGLLDVTMLNAERPLGSILLGGHRVAGLVLILLVWTA